MVKHHRAGINGRAKPAGVTALEITLSNPVEECGPLELFALNNFFINSYACLPAVSAPGLCPWYYPCYAVR